jgi:hypothetical protein
LIALCGTIEVGESESVSFAPVLAQLGDYPEPCEKWGYDLRATPGKCLECGKVVE